MKKYLITLCLAMTLAVPSQGAAQKHRHSPVAAVQVADSTRQDELEAFSDTTSNTTSNTDTVHVYHANVTVDDVQDLVEAFEDKDFTPGILIGAILLIGAMLFIFFGLPLLLLLLIIFLVMRNRKKKAQRAEAAAAAMGNASQQDGAEDFTTPQALPAPIEDLRAKGIRQAALGVGLMIFLGNTAGSVGFGIGALVTAIGVGNLLIARSQRKDI